MYLASATQTNNDPMAGGVGFVIIGALVLVSANFAHWRGWNVFRTTSYRAAVLQGMTAILVGLGMLVYALATE